MNDEEIKRLNEFQRLIDYRFKDLNLLKQALTTPHLGNELNVPHYDIIETLGDAVIKTIFISKKIRDGVNEPGEITKTKQMLENDDTLSLIARKYFHLEKYVFKSEKQEIEGTNILADVLEAICGAIYIDSNKMKLVETKIVDIFYDDWNSIIKNSPVLNKNKLLEFLQDIYRFTPSIKSEFEKFGLEHDPKWIAKNPKIYDQNKELISLELPLNLKSKPFRSKKDAEQDLFLKILRHLKKKSKL